MTNYWTAFDWGAYGKRTDHLTQCEHGAYFLLLKHYYSVTRGPIPANADFLPTRLPIICRAFADYEKAAAEKVLSEFFELRDGYYHNDRADEELEKASQISEKRSVAGKSGAEKTNRNKSANAAANARQMPQQMPTQSQLQGFVSSPKFELPVWVPEKDWKDYEEMRRRIKKPMTKRARELAVLDLEKLMDAGHDPSEVLKQSIKNSWQGLFEPKGNTQTKNGPDDSWMKGKSESEQIHVPSEEEIAWNKSRGLA